MKNKKRFFYIIVLLLILILLFGCNIKPKWKVCHPNCDEPKVVHITDNLQPIQGWPGYYIYYVNGEGYVTGYNYEILPTR
jgi:hypothetical protein